MTHVAVLDASVDIDDVLPREPTSQTRAGFGDDDVGVRGNRETQAQVLIRLAEHAEYFTDPLGKEYATIPVNGHEETWSLGQRGFRNWLARQFYDDQGKPPGHQALEEVLSVLRGRAQFEGETHSVYVRVGQADGATFLDLGDPDWRAVKITETGWDVVTGHPVRFRRPKGQAPFPVPTRGGRLDSLKELVNITNSEDWALVLAALVSYLFPEGPYPIVCVGGEQGSAKSWLVRLLRSTVDPSNVAIRATPRCERDLVISAANGWVLAYDNLSELPDWLSDAMCRLATGGGFGTRTLYADDEESLFTATRPIIVNGIGEIAQRADFRDRAILLSLEPISDDRRRTEAWLNAEFHKARPGILGALLDVASAAMRELPHVHLERLPRMADFARLAVAAAPSLGITPERFLRVYAGNRSAAATTLVEYDPVAKAVREWMESLGEPWTWTGTATELLGLLTTDERRKERDWPSRAVIFSNALTRVTPALRETGIDITRSRDSSGKRTRRVTVTWKGPSQSSRSSTVVPARLVRWPRVDQDSPDGSDDPDDLGVSGPNGDHPTEPLLGDELQQWRKCPHTADGSMPPRPWRPSGERVWRCGRCWPQEISA
jgi:hypothetical protein